MEARAKLSETENKQLKKKVAVLEAQNRTLVTQLQKMKSLLGSSKAGLGGQKSATALMVLLLSTALFAVPGFKEQYGMHLHPSTLYVAKHFVFQIYRLCQQVANQTWVQQRWRQRQQPGLPPGRPVPSCTTSATGS